MANERITTSAANPYIIANPVLGFVNLAGPAGAALMEKDRAVLDDLFRDRIVIADKTLPRCNVLFLYGEMDATGRLAGKSFTFRDLIKGAGAHVAVLASELPPTLLSNDAFMKGLGERSDWPANIVITLNRKGEYFGRFFHKLFAQMFDGTSMPMAWVALAPQGPQQPPDLPESILLMEAGPIAFGPKTLKGK